MFEKQIDRILNKAKVANIQLGKTLSIEEISAIEEDLGLKLPLSYVAYLSNIQNIGIGETTRQQPAKPNIPEHYPDYLKKDLIQAWEQRQVFEQNNLEQNTIPLNHIDLNKIEPHGTGPYHGLYSLNTSLTYNIKHRGVDIHKPFPFEADLDFGEYTNDGINISWEEHQAKLKNAPSYSSKWEELEQEYAYDTKWLSGSIPICEYGCGDEFILIINGQNKGEVWVNSLSGVTGIYSLKVDLLTFFENWLNHEINVQQGITKKNVNAYYAYLEFGQNNRYKMVENE